MLLYNLFTVNKNNQVFIIWFFFYDFLAGFLYGRIRIRCIETDPVALNATKANNVISTLPDPNLK